jgi:hypothetical protein
MEHHGRYPPLLEFQILSVLPHNIEGASNLKLTRTYAVGNDGLNDGVKLALGILTHLELIFDVAA